MSMTAFFREYSSWTTYNISISSVMSINSRFGALIVTMCSLLAKKDGLQLVITNTNLFRVAEEMMRFEDRSSELR